MPTHAHPIPADRWTALLLAFALVLLATQAPWRATAAAPGVDVAYVATGGDYPDALAGSTLASLTGAPLLLVARDTIPQATRDELERLVPASIVVLGGPAAVSDAVVAELEALTPGPVTRVSGADRFATAAEISEVLPSLPPPPAMASGDAVTNTTSTDWVEVGSVDITIPEGAAFPLVASLSAETSCVRLDGNPATANNFCAVRVLLDGEEMLPQTQYLYAIDRAPSGVAQQGFSSHSLQRRSDGAVGAGTHTVSFEVRVHESPMVLLLSDWMLLVQAFRQ